MKIKDFKHSYNKFYKVYRVEIKEHGRWRKCTYDKKIFEFLISNALKTKTELRNYKFSPYFLYVIKWFFMRLWNYIKILDPKISKFMKSGIFLLASFVLGYFYNFSQPQNEEYDQQRKRIISEEEKTIQVYEILIDSLEREIKQMELKEKNNQQFLKKSIKPKEKDSLSLKKIKPTHNN